MTCISALPPLLLERVGERIIKSTSYIPLIPAFSLKGEGAATCVDTYALSLDSTNTPHQASTWKLPGNKTSEPAAQKNFIDILNFPDAAAKMALTVSITAAISSKPF